MMKFMEKDGDPRIVEYERKLAEAMERGAPWRSVEEEEMRRELRKEEERRGGSEGRRREREYWGEEEPMFEERK